MYVLSWQAAYVHISVLFWYSFLFVLRNTGNNHQNNPLMITYTAHHLSPDIMLYSFYEHKRQLHVPFQ